MSLPILTCLCSQTPVTSPCYQTLFSHKSVTWLNRHATDSSLNRSLNRRHCLTASLIYLHVSVLATLHISTLDVASGAPLPRHLPSRAWVASCEEIPSFQEKDSTVEMIAVWSAHCDFSFPTPWWSSVAVTLCIPSSPFSPTTCFVLPRCFA